MKVAWEVGEGVLLRLETPFTGDVSFLFIVVLIERFV